MSEELLEVSIPIHCRGELVDIDSLKPNPENPKVHPQAQVEILAEVLKASGWRNPIVVSKRSGLIVKGHGRYLAAKKLGLRQCPIEYQEYSDEQVEFSDLLGDNRTAETGYMDAFGLGSILRKLSKKQQAATGYTEDEIAPLLLVEYTAPVGNDNIPVLLDHIRMSKQEKEKIMKTVQAYCLLIGADTGPGKALEAICDFWQNHNKPEKPSETGLAPVVSDKNSITKEAPIKATVYGAAANITSSTGISQRTIKIRYIANTNLNNNPVVVFRSTNNEEKFYTDNDNIVIEAEKALAENAKILIEVEEKFGNLWIRSIQRS